MSKSWESLGTWQQRVPRGPLTGEELARLQLPPTLRRIDDESALQRPVFDPALKHHANAFRASDPDFADPAARTAWLTARRTAMDLVLASVAASPWRDHLVLRGSVLLAQWFGDAAREPGDLDFVVVPAQWRLEEDRTAAMLDGIARGAERAASASTASSAPDQAVRFDARDAVSEDIWTYERAQGRRLVLPWTCGSTDGVVQLDFVFGEPLPVPPREETVGGSRLLGATPELSLAWKLLWLATDMHPQGKDLYDAVLLAEHCRVDYGLLGSVFIAADPYYAARPVTPEVTAEMSPDWEWRHFAAEYPHLAGDPAELLDRLRSALAPTFRAALEAPRGPHRWWSAQWLDACRAVHAAGGLDGLLTDLAAQRAPAAVAAAVVREFLGPDTCDPARAVGLVHEHPAWSSSADLYARRLPPGSAEKLIEAVAAMDIGA
ncbi:nucleotidyl transferase AbiEii/AbiGii toxin family protein [Actinacidiphila acididurans]|uniref:Nucleotidyl transferase AbiEii/AbiGii toxin family protein n=1 Tax=Actinacidiphila acididurans TaxID=2784346 RepID=A0ABS2TW74_9ACTN|nr:nucleotidyl transferase AbiEii/AbiGii toxin family protein [Actinacidiphila acididurans]MBM9507594.1 nucleotidyl transferase AbiEii/AbiGii toxin family protein [Actinacidiphila acididurans]